MSNEKYTMATPIECASCGAMIPTVQDSHNGAPVVDAPVCVECNYMKVIPARLSKLGLKADSDVLAAALASELERRELSLSRTEQTE